MADAPEIIQRIGIEGQENVVGALTEIGEAGLRAWELLSKLSENETFRGIVEGLGGVVATVGAAATALGIWAQKSSQAIKELGDLAEQAGVTTESVSSLQSTFANFGVSSEQMESVIKRLSRELGTTWPVIADSVKNSSQSVMRDQLDVTQSTLSLRQAHEQLADSARQASTQMRNDWLNIASATLGVEAAQQRLDELRGRPPSDAQKKQLEIKQAELALNKAIAAQSDAYDASITNMNKNQLTASANSLAVKRADMALDDQREKQQKNLKENVENVAAALRGEATQVGYLQEKLELAEVSREKILQGIIYNAGRAAAAAKNLQGVVKPTDNDVIYSMADAFQKIEDVSLKTSVAMAALGRGVSYDFIQALSKGKDYIKDYQAEMQKLGLVITTEMTHAAEELDVSFNRLSNDVQITSRQLGVAFAPAYAEGLKVLDDALRESHKTLMDWANSLSEFVKPAIVDLFRLISGQGEKIETGWIAGLYTVFQGLGKVIEFVVTAFKGWVIIINSVFKTNISLANAFLGVLVAIGVAFGGWPALILTVASAIGALWNKMGGIEGIKTAWSNFMNWVRSTWVGSIINAVTSMYRAIANFDLKATWNSFLNWFNGTWVGSIFQGIGKIYDWFKGIDLQSSWQSFLEWFNGTWMGQILSGLQSLIAKAKELWDWMSKANSKGDEGSGDKGSSTPPGYAGGGEVRGPGHGTSDSILARVSNGEFIMRERAVSHFGKSFMHSVNNLTLPHFAEGGLVSVRPQSGGDGHGSRSSETPHTVNLTLDGHRFNGLKASTQTAQDLVKYAQHRNITSTGKKPSWVKGG